MHDNQLEDRIRAVLRAEGDVLPLTIMDGELDRRLALRRRERFGRRFSFVAAGIGIVALGSALVLSNGWLRTSDVGSDPSQVPGFDTGTAASPAISIPSAASGACETIDPAAMDEPPRLLMGTSPGDGRAISGQRSSYRLGERQVGDEGTWDHDTIGMESVVVGFPSEGLQLLSSDPDACLVGLRVDALPEQDPDLESTRIADNSFDPTRVVDFDKPPVGDWFIRVHAEFATVPGATAWAEAFFVVEVADCTPIDTTALAAPPTVDAAVAFDDATRRSGVLAASEWNGRRLGTVGSWAAPLAGLGPIVVYPESQPVEFASDACLVAAEVEAVRIDPSGNLASGVAPTELPIVRGIGTRVIAIDALPVGEWAVRVRSSFLTADGSPGWSETIFRVESAFVAPGLTIGPDYFEIWSEAHCTSYRLETGASGDDACTAEYELKEGREPLAGSSTIPLRFRLTDGWVIDVARVVAVEAELVEAGQFAPEYSVSFQEDVGSVLVVPIQLDPGAWIVRLSLNGRQDRDTFSATYDVPVNVGDEQAVAIPTVHTNGSPHVELLNVSVGECLREANVLTVGPDVASADVAIDAIGGAHGWIEASTDLGPISYWHGDLTSAAVAFDAVKRAIGPGSPWILGADGTARELRSMTTPRGRTIWRTGDSAGKVRCAPDS